MKNILQLTYLNNKIRGLLENIQAGNVPLTRRNLNALSSMMERYISAVESCADIHNEEIDSYVKDSVLFEQDFSTLAKAASRLNEGFYNPFDDDDENLDLKSLESKDHAPKINIKGLYTWDPKKKQKIKYEGGKVIACTTFLPNDTIEEAPVKNVSKGDMYSRFIRDNAICIDKERNMYVVPFGYVPFYNTTDDIRETPNARVIVKFNDDNSVSNAEVVATAEIKPGREIIIDAGDRAENVFVPGDYDYKHEPEPVYSFKNFRIE